MGNTVQDNMELTKSLSERIQPIIEPLSQLFGIHTFGYRKFFPDGKSCGVSNNLFWTSFCSENFDKKIIPNYENEVSAVLNKEKFHFFRIGKPDNKNAFLTALYDLDIWNTLSLYRKSGDCIEGFYFASTRENCLIIEEYINNINLFERFSIHFKDKFTDIISTDEIKSITSPTISPTVFEKKDLAPLPGEQAIKSFISKTPIQRFFLNVDEKDISLSPQEFKCLALLGRGKTAKEIGQILKISQRTVEGYIENVKHKINVNSRNRLIDLFALNFYKNKDLLKYLENLEEDK